MDLYGRVSYRLARIVTTSYSTSFSLSSSLFSNDIRPHIMAVYGLVRIGDEIVDTYEGTDKIERLKSLEAETLLALRSGYSANPIVHAFGLMARRFNVPEALVTAFFASMRMDTEPQTYTQESYDAYIYGSAEVIGLMCLKVFLDDDTTYTKLSPGAQKLGSAYQKINFLRDIADDATQLKRWYFPSGSFESFDDAQRDAIVSEIRSELREGKTAARHLPSSSRSAVLLSIDYFSRLLESIATTPTTRLKTTRVRLPNAAKLSLLIQRRLTKGGVRG